MSGARSFSTQVPQAVQARVRATVRGMQLLHGGGYTLARFTTEAPIEHALRLEDLHHGGTPWDAEQVRLPRGARLSDTNGDTDGA